MSERNGGRTGEQKTTPEYFRSEVRHHVGDRLRSLVLYGSALTDDFVAARSDYNFMVVADPLDLDLLDRLAPHAKAWRKKRIPAPLLFSPEFIERAQDSYPLEFLAMLARYEVLEGADVLAGVAVEKDDVRLQCESELRGKLLLFRRVYVESGLDPKHLQSMVVHGIPALYAIFRGLLFLGDGPWNTFGAEFRAACSGQLGIDRDMLDHLNELRHRKQTPKREEMRSEMERLFGLLHRLANEADRW